MWPLSAARENHAARLTGNLRGALGFRFKAMGVRSACRAAQLGDKKIFVMPKLAAKFWRASRLSTTPS
jgi:hypothetical protein